MKNWLKSVLDNWSGTVTEYQNRMKRVNWNDYEVVNADGMLVETSLLSSSSIISTSACLVAAGVLVLVGTALQRNSLLF